MTNPTLIIVVDAFKCDYLKHSVFLKDYAKEHTYAELSPLFGFEPGFVSHFTGTHPITNGIWTVFCYNPRNSIYKWTRHFLPFLNAADKIPKIRNFIRYGVSAVSLCRSKSTYLQDIHEIPYGDLGCFDLSLKQDITTNRALKSVVSLFDILHDKKIPFEFIHGNLISTNRKPPGISYPHVSDNYTFKNFERELNNKSKFHFLYFSDLDKIGHAYGPCSRETIIAVKKTDDYIRNAVHLFEDRFKEANITIFSDHGMVEVNNTIDILSVLNDLRIEKKDYLVFLDSTFARLWFKNKKTERDITSAIEGVKNMIRLTRKQLEKYHVNFHDNRYGSVIFTVKPNSAISPNYFQTRINRGMHGYFPETEGMGGIFIMNKGDKNTKISYTDVFPSILDATSLTVPSTCEGKSILN